MDEEKYKEYFEILEIEESAGLAEIKHAHDRLIRLYTSDSMVLEPIDDEFDYQDRQEIIDEIREAYKELMHFLIEKDQEPDVEAEPVPVEEEQQQEQEEQEQVFELEDTLVETLDEPAKEPEPQETGEIPEPGESQDVEAVEDVQEVQEEHETGEAEESEIEMELELPDEPLDLGEPEELTQLQEPLTLIEEPLEPRETFQLDQPLDPLVTQQMPQAEAVVPEPPEQVSPEPAKPKSEEPEGPQDLLSDDHPIAPAFTDTQPFIDAPAGDTNKFPDSGQTMVKPRKPAYPPDATMLRIEELTKTHTRGESKPPQPPSIGPEPVYKGRNLKKIRENLELGIHEIAIATRINYKILVNIEKEKFDKLPEGGLLRWHVITYAKALKLDPQEVAEDYMRRYRRWKKQQSDT